MKRFRSALSRFFQQNISSSDGIFVPKLYLTLRQYSAKQFRSDLMAGAIVASSRFTPSALAIGVFTTLAIFFWPESWRKIPGSIVILAVVTLLSTTFHLPVETIGSRFGGVPHGLPSPSLPHFSWTQMKML